MVSAVPLLSNTDTLLVVVAGGITVHLIYNQFEPHKLAVAFVLLLGIPSALSALYLPHAGTIGWAALKVFPLFWSSLVSSIILYRVSPLHPLARYPGPLLCKVSKFYLAFRSLGGKQYLHLNKLHEQYGNVVRIGPNELSICDASAVQPLLGNAGMPKGQFWEGRIPTVNSVKSLIAIRDKTEHARRRRPWARAFKAESLKGYEDMIVKRSNQLVESLEAAKGVTNLTEWFSFFTYDIMSDLAFGGGSEMMAQGDATGLWHMIEASQKNAIFMGHVPWLGKMILRFPSMFAKDLKAFGLYARSRANARRTEGSPHMDIFYHLIDEDGVFTEPPTPVEVTSDGGLAIIAGSDTTSTAMSHLFYFLMCNPTAYKRLQAEVDELGDDILDTSKQAHMPYLNAAINETLRLLPPVLGGSLRESQKGSGGNMLGPYYVPEGNSASIATYSLHRDPRNFFPATESFHPERWLPEQQRIELEPKVFSNMSDFVHNPDAFIPFSHGSANCAGKNLAYMEMRMVICMMMQRVDMKFAEGYNPEQWLIDIKDFFVSLKGALPTIVTPRK